MNPDPELKHFIVTKRVSKFEDFSKTITAREEAEAADIAVDEDVFDVEGWFSTGFVGYDDTEIIDVYPLENEELGEKGE